MPTLILLQGISGSGKTTWAKNFQQEKHSGTVICSADDYWGIEYKFDPTKLPEAHKYCQLQCKLAMRKQAPFVLVDNTNINDRGLGAYLVFAEVFGYDTFVKRIDTDLDEALRRNATRPPHRKVPEHVVKRQFGSLIDLGLPFWEEE